MTNTVLNSTLQTIVTVLRKLRLIRLLSQSQLARLSGVSRTTIAAIENSQHKPQALTMYKLAKALDVDPKEIDNHDSIK